MEDFHFAILTEFEFTLKARRKKAVYEDVFSVCRMGP
jgi:hypothetical protein